jgi:hypothetical protein
MNLNDNVVYRCLRLGSIGQLHPGRSCCLVGYNYCFHGKSPWLSVPADINPPPHLSMRISVLDET